MAPPSCADSRGTTEEAERLLGRSLATVDGIDFEANVSEEPDGTWSLRLVTIERASRERRERQLVGASCDEVGAAAAVAMAMVVSGGGEKARDTEPGPHPPAEEAPSTAQPGPPPQFSRASRTRPSRLSGAVSLGGAADVGSLPGVSPGVEVTASLRRGSVQGSLLGAFYTGSRTAGGEGADFELAVVGLLACARSPVGRAQALVCAGIEGGRLGATGVGLDRRRADGTFWWAPRVDTGVSWPLTARLSLLVRLGAALPRARPEYVVDGDTFVHRPGAAVGRAGLGLELVVE